MGAGGRGRPALEKEGGRRGRWVGGRETGSGAAARGLGALGSGLWSEGSKEEEMSEQGSGDLVLGGHGPEWAESIWEAEQDSQREGQE